MSDDALCEELAKQQLCVVIAALDDEHLPKAVAELEAAYPGLEFRAVACNFGPGQSYLDKIAKATADVDVQLVFNNAGFIVTGFGSRRLSPAAFQQQLQQGEDSWFRCVRGRATGTGTDRHRPAPAPAPAPLRARAHGARARIAPSQPHGAAHARPR